LVALGDLVDWGDLVDLGDLVETFSGALVDLGAFVDKCLLVLTTLAFRCSSLANVTARSDKTIAIIEVVFILSFFSIWLI
jgi:hypothetical protein